MTRVVRGGTDFRKIGSERSSREVPRTPYHPVPPPVVSGPQSGGNAERSCLVRGEGTLQDWVAAHAAEIAGWHPVATDSDPGCLVAACDRSAFAVNLCRAHYKRASRAFRAEGR